MAKDTMPLFRGSCKFYVYIYRDPRPRKKKAVIYVEKGLAKKRRADIHWRQHTHNVFFKRILDKIRLSGLEPLIEIVDWFEDEQKALECERLLIAKFGRRYSGSGTLCNLSEGGEGVSGFSGAVWTEDRRKAFSDNNPMKDPEILEKYRKSANDPELIAHRSKLMSGQRNPMKRPEIRESRSGANHHAKRPEVRAKYRSDKNPAKQPEAREKMRIAALAREKKRREQRLEKENATSDRLL